MNFRNFKTMCCLFRTHNLLRALSLLTVLAALWLCLLTPRTAQAAAYTYDTSARRTVNAGVILLDSTDEGGGKGASDKDPYVFHVLNQRIDIRPFGWNIVNPLAPATVTQAIQARWYARSNNTQVYGIGQTVTPNMAPYWEVDLHRTAADDLAQFDVLFLGIDTNRVARFSVTDTQKLLRFVDNGGILWIEYVGNAVTAPNLPIDSATPLFFSLQFHGSIPGMPGGAYGTLGAGAGLPLVTKPYQLSTFEMNSLGDKRIGDYYIDDNNGGSPGVGLLSNVLGNSGQGSKPLIAAGTLGAGGIVVSVMGIANAINETVDSANNIAGPDGYNSGPYCSTNFLNAPTANLKFLSNLLASVGTHPNAHQNSHNTGFTPNGIPSASRIWTTTGGAGNGGGNSPAVVNGNYVYVTTGSTLRCYDLNPAEDLDGNGNPDDGDLDYSQGAPYDQVWHADVGANASAPTVAVDPTSGTSVVFVERADGSVIAFYGTQGGAFTPSPLTKSDNRGTYNSPAPAPTYYNGKLYAGGADGSLYVYDLRPPNPYTGSSGSPPPTVDPSSPASPIVAPPTLGTIMDGGANDIVAQLTTANGMYTVYLGARGETLSKSGADYTSKLKALGSAKMDTNSATWKVYSIPNPSDGYPSDLSGNFTASPTSTFFKLTTPFVPPLTIPLLGNYDVDITGATGSAPLTRTFVSLTSGPTTPGGGLSAPALDRFGNTYYTTNNALFCVHDTANLPQIQWRFRIPTVPMTDADNVPYGALVGFQFVGAPVVDEKGLVYALATNGIGSVVLCFNGQLGVSADAPGAGTNISISQIEPTTAPLNEFGNPAASSNINGNQFNINTDGHIEFSNFAPNAGGGRKTLNPNLNEPFPIQIQVNVGQNQTPPPPFTVGLHTNLVWYSGTAFPNFVPASGLTKVGNALFYTATNGHLISVDAITPSNGKIFADAPLVAPATQPTANSMFHDTGDTGVGAGAVPSSANGVLIVNGPKGVSAYTNQVTIVADSNRIVEADSNGNLMWSVDSTQKTTVTGGDTPVYNGGVAPANPGQYVTTTLELNRPSSISELTANDYLVADTGNNRCVRFDRGAKVIWELTKFYQDPSNPLLRPGEPDTLNQPTGVQIRSYTSGTNTIVQYLVADSGNFRIVEISDVYDSKFNLIKDHVLTWVSHTHDVQGRQYRYTSASIYYAPNGKQYVVALVTNRRIAPMSRTSATPILAQLAPANQDTNGGSIALLDYDPDPTHAYGLPGFGTGGQASGFIAIEATNTTYTLDVINSIEAYLTPTGGFDLNTTLNPGGAKTRRLSLRNPRFLKSYAPPSAQNTDRNYLLADDNGVFDLKLNGGQFVAQWGFTQTDYRMMTTPLDAAGVKAGVAGAFNRSRIPFVPTCVQKLSANDYLLTNGFGQGETGTTFGDYGNAIPPGFGGEVFEVDTSGPTPVITGYGGHTLSRPTNAAPLTQPTFAHRVQ